jgi:hypothetical protein
VSLYDYEVGRELERQDVPFHALIMAAMRRASTDNLARLQAAFPAVWEELQARYHAPGGVLAGEWPPFAVGEQVAYVPTHAGGDLAHPDVEFGFVTSTARGGDCAFVRYWRKGRPGELRTVANGECTPVALLVRHESVAQDVVTGVLELIEAQP